MEFNETHLPTLNFKLKKNKSTYLPSSLPFILHIFFIPGHFIINIIGMLKYKIK